MGWATRWFVGAGRYETWLEETKLLCSIKGLMMCPAKQMRFDLEKNESRVTEKRYTFKRWATDGVP